MTKHVFLTFVEEDLALVNLFRGQAKNKNSSLAFDDYSVKVPYNSTNATYIRTQIKSQIVAASVTICLIGSTTHRSEWVDWEIETSFLAGNKLIGVKLPSTATLPIPPALTRRSAKVLSWDIDAIVREIG